MSKITPFLWFDTQALEAAKFYTSIFPNSSIHDEEQFENSGPDENQTVQIVSFVLDGQEFQAMNAGPLFKFNESVSWLVDCADQAEVDYYWEKLTADGGEESQCGWLKDKYGVSWQIVPKALGECFARDTSGNVMKAMLGMKKLIVSELEEAVS